MHIVRANRLKSWVLNMRTTCCTVDRVHHNIIRASRLSGVQVHQHKKRFNKPVESLRFLLGQQQGLTDRSRFQHEDHLNTSSQLAVPNGVWSTTFSMMGMNATWPLFPSTCTGILIVEAPQRDLFAISDFCLNYPGSPVLLSHFFTGSAS